MRRVFAVLGLILAAFMLGKAAIAAPEEAPSAAVRTQWVRTYEVLTEAVNALLEAREESIESKINETLKDDTHLSVAQKIQTILRERNRRISEAARKGLEAADQERWAFEQLHRCSVSDSPRRSTSSTAGLNAVGRERNKLLADLQELLLDEAYVQYRRENPNPPSTHSGYGPDQQSAQYQYRQSGPDPRMGYGSYAPGYGYQ